MPTYPTSKIVQIHTQLARMNGDSVLLVVALCEDGSVWQLSRDLHGGEVLGGGWEQYPTGGAQ